MGNPFNTLNSGSLPRELREALNREVDNPDLIGGDGFNTNPSIGGDPITSDIQIIAGTFYLVNTQSNQINLTIFTSANTAGGMQISVKNQSDSLYLVRLLPNGSDTIDGKSLLEFSGRANVVLQSDGISDWMII